ncbi:acetyl-CoA synthetase-like protein [Sistotremastrum suecicum HHB10207 ss-3]|uniref:Acetyl-CoA synthetase-like protein n=1 Tax=Sistotremastrum suecicum HHB10207 ss-3 TaxID=1314776 RepID=A0A166GGJ2_9AGAM|nr:acetyl-CoA synthetase-like protein [Sistotremastrum suecicum HHB10207 ss-3]
MPIQSLRPVLNFPTIDLLTWIFDDDTYQYDRSKPLFISASNPKRYLTGHGLREMSMKLGHGLRELVGVKPGDVILCASPNHLLYPVVVYGTICAGAIFTGCNPTYGESELLHQLRDSGATVVFASTVTLALVLTCAARLGIPRDRIFLIDGSGGGVRSIEELLQYEGRDWPRLTTFREVVSTIAALVYSSGTTGLSKGCEITHWNFVSQSASSISSQYYPPIKKVTTPKEDTPKVFLGYMPFFHVAGMLGFVINNPRQGHLTYIVEQFTFPIFLDAIQRFRITDLVVVPPVAVLLAKSPLVKKYDLSSLRTIVSGAAPLGTEVALAVEKVLDPDGARNVKVAQAWGMSEVTGAATGFDYGDWDEETKRFSVGTLISGSEAMIVDEDEMEVKDGEQGEIWMRAPFVFKGYWKNEKATRETITPDGWLKTGDIGRIDHRGMFYIMDRKKEMIKVKGFQVAPAELEATLLLNPGVADAAVIGVPRYKYGGEHPRAYVVKASPEVTAASLEAWVASRLASYKRLTGGVEFVDVVPKSASGKILRQILRDRASKGSLVEKPVSRL